MMREIDGKRMKDMYITNGYVRASTFLDYLTYDYPNALDQARKSNQKLGDGTASKLMPEIKVSNYMYQNKGDLQFANTTHAWGMNRPSFSNGAANGDLDNDGDQDLEVNNLKEAAYIYRNQSAE